MSERVRKKGLSEGSEGERMRTRRVRELEKGVVERNERRG